MICCARWLLLVAFSSAGMAFAADRVAPHISKAEWGGPVLELSFDTPMLTWPAATDLATVSIDPAYPCRWAWSDGGQLFCTPAETDVRPKPATRYTVSMHGGLWSQWGIEIGDKTLSADSELPQISRQSVEWQGGQPVIAIETNLSMTAEMLRAHLDVAFEDGSPLAYVLTSNPPERKTNWQPNPPPRWKILVQPGTSADQIFHVRVTPGLKSSEGLLVGTQDEVLLRARVNEPLRLREVGCNSDSAVIAPTLPNTLATASVHCPAGTIISLEFSGELTPQALALLRSQWPLSGEFLLPDSTAGYFSRRENLVHERLGHRVQFAANDPGRVHTINLSERLAADDGRALDRPSRLVITVGDFPPSLALAPPQIVVPLGADIPPIIATMNRGKLDASERDLGGNGFETSKTTLPSTRKNVVVRVSPPDATRDVRRSGGLVEGSLATAGAPANWEHTRYSVAYAGFNITASQSGDQVLIWTTAWDSAAPIAGATVEMLRLGKTAQDPIVVLATGITDNDGVAMIDLPSSAKPSEGSLIVRATHAGQRALMPYSLPLQNARTTNPHGYRFDQVAEGEQTSWGVTDRPLYRPGDMVNYRVWLRQRQANHLHPLQTANDAKLALKSYYGGTVINTFVATADSYGSIAGSFRLPMQLHDDNYCIAGSTQSPFGLSGACFRVTGFHVNDFWTELHANKDIALDGDTVSLDATTGYYSGGPAANARVSFQSLLTPVTLEETYPKFREFRFVDPYEKTEGNGGEQFSEALPNHVATDAQGHARIEATLVNAGLAERLKERDQKLIPFGKLEFIASGSASVSSFATSAPATLRFSRYPRFVGLKVTPWLLSADADPQVEAVVITHEGTALPDAVVQLTIEEENTADDSAAKNPLAHCELRAGQTTSCAFRPKHSGLYRFRASSDGAASTVIARYAFLDAHWVEKKEGARAKLSVSTSTVAAGDNAEVMVQQPFAKAQALMTIEHGRILKHWLQTLDGQVTKLSIPIEAGWSPGVTISAAIIDAGGSAFGRNAQTGELIELGSVDIQITTATAAPQLTVDVDRHDARPGEDIAISLRSQSDEPLQVTLGVVDDAVRALVPDLTVATDPQGEQWLGKLKTWDVPTWYGLGGWARSVTDVKRDYFAHTIFQFEQSDAKLETIEVTGSNISVADVFSRGSNSDHSLGAPMFGGQLTNGPGLRNRFLETAAWQTDIELAAHDTRTIHVRLPDNLTRWRVLAWSANASDKFSLAQTTVEAKLPIELRAEVPARLFPGDDTYLAVSVRNHAATTQTVRTQLSASGAGIKTAAAWGGAIAANEQRSVSVAAHPTAAGKLDVAARANSATAADGIAASVEIMSPEIRGKVSVGGWLSDEGASLKIPPLPAGASHPHLQVKVARGVMAMATIWIDYLRDYPHRCWEQMLSRAISAAVAKKFGLDSAWPDANDVINEALNSAGEFQDSNGVFHFFVGPNGAEISSPSMYLTAYSVSALNFLHELGYNVSPDVLRKAEQALSEKIAPLPNGKSVAVTPFNRDELVLVMAALSADAIVADEVVDQLWNERAEMSWFARAEFAKALAVRPKFSAHTKQLLTELRDAGHNFGNRRLIDDAHSNFWPLSSRLRNQCGVIAALAKLDHNEDAAQVRTAYLRGLLDLYAGGIQTFDTQADSQCLMMLVHATPPEDNGKTPVTIALNAGGITTSIILPTDQIATDWSSDMTPLPASLGLHTTAIHPMLLSFVATIEYDEDGRRAQASDIGYSLQRRYAVLLDHAWKDVPSAAIHEGDWVRTTLRISNRKMRYFVAVSDSVPGGLRPTDLELSGVSDLELRALASPGNPFFPARQIDDRFARFYAEQLPPGIHEIHYYSRATHAGNYAALPANAELMYGGASVARTAATRLSISPAITAQGSIPAIHESP